MANPNSAIGMGFFQPEWLAGCFKRKFRWKFIIPSLSADGVFSLPPSKSARPNLTFKTMEAPHLNETIFYPAKPDWKPVQLQLYDMLKYDEGGNPLSNPIFSWIMRAYDPLPDVCGQWNPSLGDTDDQAAMPGFKAAYAFLELYDGCGVVMERWIFEHVWPESVDWGDLNYAESEVVMCDLTLRYDRAFIDCSTPSQWCATFVPTFPTVTSDTCPFTTPTPVIVPKGPSYCSNSPDPSFLTPPDAPVNLTLVLAVEGKEPEPEFFAAVKSFQAMAPVKEPPPKRKFLVKK